MSVYLGKKKVGVTFFSRYYYTASEEEEKEENNIKQTVNVTSLLSQEKTNES